MEKVIGGCAVTWFSFVVKWKRWSICKDGCGGVGIYVS